MTLEQRGIVIDALRNPEKISEKDLGFVKNLDEKWTDRDLSDAQIKWLKSIEKKVNS